MATSTAVKRRFDSSISSLRTASQEVKTRRIAFVPPRSTPKCDDDGFSFPENYFVDPVEVRELVGWKAVQSRGLGLRNCGNTCYMNSVLQALTHSSAIANDALRDNHTSTCARKKANLFCGYCQLLTHTKNALTSKGRSDIAPEPIIRQLKLLAKNMRFGRQEDSHEFLRQLIDSCVHGELPLRLTSNPKAPLVPPLARSTTFVGQLFSGYLQSQVTCGSCGNISRTFDPYMDISLEIQDSHSLVDCLRKFTRPDSLAGPNAYKCGKCHKRVSATKQMLVHRTPPLLTIQLKRFNAFASYRGHAQKINKRISFASSLDMNPFMSSSGSGPLNYSLYAVIVHEGSSMGSGHYVCYAKAGNGVWYLFNDSQVHQVGEQTVLNQSAYILMYESKDDRCFYSSHANTPVKEVTSEPPVRITTPTGVTVINHEMSSESEESSADESDYEEKEPDLVPTGESLNKRPKGAMAVYIQRMQRAVVPPCERKMLRMLTVMRLAAKKSRRQTPISEIVTRATGASSQWGSSVTVRTWDDAPIDNRVDIVGRQQTNVPEPGARSQYDVEYDLGKSMHNPRSETAARKGIPASLADSFNAIASGEAPIRPYGGKGKGKGFNRFNRR